MRFERPNQNLLMIIGYAEFKSFSRTIDSGTIDLLDFDIVTR